MHKSVFDYSIISGETFTLKLISIKFISENHNLYIQMVNHYNTSDSLVNMKFI